MIFALHLAVEIELYLEDYVVSIIRGYGLTVLCNYQTVGYEERLEMNKNE